MEYRFTAGTYKFHDDPNFNYQMNRWMAFGNIPEEDIRSAAQNIKTIADWIREFLLLAEKYRLAGDVLKQACACRAADFFMPYGDPNKPVIYARLVRLFREYYKDCFGGNMIAEYHADFDGVSLPVWYARSAQDKSKGTIIITGGFDCYKEELVPVILYFADRGFDTYYFEGPGQGEVLLRSRLPMTHEWEKPVGAVLDRFNLKDVTLIGLSLGGCLAPRAAAYEPRIKRVVAWGTMYDFYRVVSTRRGKVLAAFIDALMALKLAPLLNLLVRISMRTDPYIFWGVDHGTHVMGVSTPYEYFKALKRYTTKRISRLVKQDFLLLTGAEDHFCELKTFYRQSRALVNVRSFTGRIFTKAEHAENHCQFGNIELALRTMADWIVSVQKKVDA